MSEFLVRSVVGSPFGRAVLATLAAKDAPYRFASIEFAALGSDAHLARHPFGKVPVLEHGDFALYETSAILRYLDRACPAPALTPTDPKAAARMDQAIAICDGYLFPRLGRVVAYHRFVGPRVFGIEPHEAALAEAVAKGRQVLAVLSRLLGPRPYVAGEDLSLADIVMVAQLEFLSHAPDWPALTAETPNLVDYAARLDAQPLFAATRWTRVVAAAQAA